MMTTHPAARIVELADLAVLRSALDLTEYQATHPDSALAIMADYLRLHEAIPTARVSYAQAKGNAKKYSYWGATRYEIRMTIGRYPSNMPNERASSDRRSEKLAQRDCDELCERENRLECHPIGRVSEATALSIMTAIARFA